MGIVSCSVEGCVKAGRLVKGLCNSHYHRLRAYGDPLAGAASRGHVQEYYRGRVLSYHGTECLIWPFARSSGYAVMGLAGKVETVSRLVCTEVHGPPPTPAHQAAHSCGNGHLGCVSRRHLSWKTPAGNQADRLVHDTHRRGERHVGVKLSEADAKEITKLKGAKSQREIAKQFNVSRTAVRLIHEGKNWAWIREIQHG